MTQIIKSSDLSGLFPAIPTPVNANGKIDHQAAESLINYLVNAGIHGFVPIGGTGEYGALSRQERVTMTSLCVKYANGKPVIPGVLDPGFYDAQEVGSMLADAGANALMLLTPYYTNPTQQGIKDYFLRYADNSPLPVLIYEIPYRTRIAIDPKVLHELSKHENIIGMKACNTDMYHFTKVVAGVADDFAVLSGEDTLFPTHLAAGATGAIVVTASVLPKVWLHLLKLCQEKRYDEAFTLHRSLVPFMDLAFSETNPGPLKSVWDCIDVNAPHVLTPLVPANENLHQSLRAELIRLLENESTY